MYKTCHGYCCRGKSIPGSTGRSVVGSIKAPGINQPSLRSRTVKEICKTEIIVCLFVCLFVFVIIFFTTSSQIQMGNKAKEHL